MKTLKPVIALIAFLLVSNLHAQVAINSSGSAPDASAMLDVVSTTSGMLVPRMTMVERDAISSPATGLLIYQTDGTFGFYYNSGTPSSPNWTAIAGGSSITSGDLTSSDITVTNGTGAVIGSGTSLAIIKGDLTESTSSVLTITGGTSSVLGSGTTIQVTQADATHSGYLLSSDWNTFNSNALPSQTGESGNFLTTDGTTPSWSSVSVTETDPVVKAINGIVKSNGTTISAAVAGTDYQAPITFPLPIDSGGTGQTTASAALNALLPAQTGYSGYFLTTDGTAASWSSASITETDPVVKAINGIVKSNGTTISAAVAGTDYQAPITFPLPIDSGGTGQTTASAALNALLPSQTGDSGYFLTTNGTAASWSSTSITETDPVVKAINGIVKSNGTTISAAVAGTDYQAPVTFPLPIDSGGTGITSVAQGDLLYGSATNTISNLVKDNSGNVSYLSNTGTDNNPAWAQVDLTQGVSGLLPIANGGLPDAGGQKGLFLATDTITGTPYWTNIAAGGVASVNASYPLGLDASSTSTNPVIALNFAVPVVDGGTNITSYSVGDMLYASASTILSKLSDPGAGYVLISGGPSWGQIDISSTQITGKLPIANGGTNSSSISSGVVKSDGTTLSGGTVSLTNGSSDISGILSIANGGTNTNSITSGIVKSNGSTLSGGNTINLNIGSSDISGTLSIANGGTNSTSLANGQLLYYNGTAVASTGIGLTYNGTLLTTTSIKATGSFTGAFYRTVTTTGSSYSALATDDIILCTSATMTVNLPSASSISGKVYLIKKAVGTSGTITITPATGEKIDGATGNKTITGTTYSSYELISDGSGWWIISQKYN